MTSKMLMPEMGEGVIEGTISKWFKQIGEYVKQYEPVLEIETDKVTVEATSEVAGYLLQQCFAEGDVASVGAVLAYIGDQGEKAAPAKPKAAVATAEATAVVPPTISRSSHGNGKPGPVYTGRISPVVSRIAAEHQVDLNQITGTGRDGRITKKDILAYIEQRDSQPEPVIPAPLPPRTPALLPRTLPGDLLPLTSMRRTIAEHMVRSKHTSPHVTTVFEVDFTAVAAHRTAHKEQFKRDGADLTYTAYIMSATVQALKAHPMVNSSWSDEGIVLHRPINVGMATALTNGLVVPVIKNADSLNLLGLARTINELTERARNKQLQLSEMQGGTFTLTNHGTSGSLFGTPIINQPQCAILGVGKIEKRVKVIDDAIAIRPLAFVSLTFDHRILDGKGADEFMVTLKDTLENWQQ